MFPCSDFISSYLLLIRTHMDGALTDSRRFSSEWSCNWSVGIGCIEAITPRKWWNCPVGNRLQLEKPGLQSVSLTSDMDQLPPLWLYADTFPTPSFILCEQLSFINHLSGRWLSKWAKYQLDPNCSEVFRQQLQNCLFGFFLSGRNERSKILKRFTLARIPSSLL